MNPTQVKYPWRAALRTTLAYIAGAGIVVPIAWGITQDSLGVYLSPSVVAAIAWTVGLIVAVSASVTRIMAIPQVNDWLTRLGVGASPASSYVPQHMESPEPTDAELAEAAHVRPGDEGVDGFEDVR